MREAAPRAAVDGSAMIARPSAARLAPRMKSIWPPIPEYMRGPIESATTWPVRSISIAELIAVIRLNATDHVRVVREVDRAHLDHRVVVDEVVQAFRAHQERGHELARGCVPCAPR